MKPAICPVCGALAANSKGDHVEFSDYEPLPSGYMGHPQGFEWFCADHLEAARSMSHLTAENAIKTMQEKFGICVDQLPPKSPPKSSAISRLLKAVTGK